jgi:hypothetical protein
VPKGSAKRSGANPLNSEAVGKGISGANPDRSNAAQLLKQRCESSAAAKKLKALQKRRKTNTRSEAALICEADYTIGVDDCAATKLLKAAQLLKSKTARA